MEWSNEGVLEFLNLYENHPVIWDASHHLHKNRNNIHDAWLEIKNNFSKPCSITELKKKKGSLMNQKLLRDDELAIIPLESEDELLFNSDWGDNDDLGPVAVVDNRVDLASEDRLSFFVLFTIIKYSHNWISTVVYQNEDACLSRTIEQFFAANSTVYFISNGNKVNVNIGAGFGSYVFVDIQKPTRLSLKHGCNYVLYSEYETTEMFLQYLVDNNIWGESESPKGKFLLITKKSIVMENFKLLWKRGILNALILSKELDGIPIVHACNPYAIGNNCGRNATECNSQPCTQNLRINLEIPIKDLNGCPITFATESRHLLKKNITSFHYLLYFIFDEIGARLNSSFEIRLLNGSNFFNISQNYELVILLQLNRILKYFEGTQVIYRSNFVWILPEPPRIINLVTVFKIEVWLAIAVTYFTVMMCWKMLSVFGNNSETTISTFVEVTSLTFCSNIHRVPTMIRIRFVFVLYILYVVIIHTAFKSNLVNVLTVPKFGLGITTIEELADNKLPVYTASQYKELYFKHDENDSSIYAKIKNLLLVHYNNKPISHTTYAVLMSEIDLQISTFGKKEVTYIVDNMVTGNLQTLFGMKKGHHLILNLNIVIMHLFESGKYGKSLNEFNTKTNGTESDEGDSKIPLSMDHLYFIFLIMLAGLMFAMVVFIVELKSK
ncbi:hypothetical protein FQR65_LT06868 [Abscondita terminalis]|nr:hypothetical protein FQR65_LT06868 [Abscondita terminalis]